MACKAMMVVAATLLPGTAAGQYQMVSPMLYNGPRISLEDHAARSTSWPSSDPSSPRTADPAAMVYRPDPTRRRANLAQFVQRAQAADPAGGAALGQMFAQGDFFAMLQGSLTPMGLRVDDLADAYAIYWIVAFNATHGVNPTPSRRQLDAVKRQATAALGNTAEFRSATDATKQELAETLWIQMILLDGAIDRAKGDAAQLAAVGKAAAQGARGMGLDLSAMTLSEDGFRTGAR
jgi:hypothetical protein